MFRSSRGLPSTTAAWTGVPTPSAPADRQDPLPIFRCPGNASMLRRVFPDHLITCAVVSTRTLLCGSTGSPRVLPLLSLHALVSAAALGGYLRRCLPACQVWPPGPWRCGSTVLPPRLRNVRAAQPVCHPPSVALPTHLSRVHRSALRRIQPGPGLLRVRHRLGLSYLQLRPLQTDLPARCAR